MIIILSSIVLFIILVWSLYTLRLLLSGVRANLFKAKEELLQRDNNDLPSFSVIIAAKNEARVIRRCLEAIMNLDYPSDKLEVIVVDGASKDDTLNICQEFSREHPKLIKILNQTEPCSKPPALNLALSNSRGEIIAVFDADSVPERDVLMRAANKFRDGSVMAIQGRTISINEGYNILTKVSSMQEKIWFRTLLQGRDKMGLFVPLTGSCQFLRKKMLLEVGGWNEDSLAEDVDLSAKMLEKGHSVKYEPYICSWQESPRTLKGLALQRVRWFRGYMETAIIYGRLMRKMSWKRLDAEMALIGPFVMVLCLLSYALWILSPLKLSTGTSLIDPASIAPILTVVTITSMGAALTLYSKPFNLRNLAWIPFIYIYWFIEMATASWALFQILFKRPRVWTKTEKFGTISSFQAGITESRTV